MKTYNTLGFDDRNRVGEWYAPNLALARAEGRKLKLKTASATVKEGNSFLAVLIDDEWDFGDTGRLPVKGTFDDVFRTIKRLKRAVLEERLTDLIVTIDLHPPFTIHSDGWWEDPQGNPPDVTAPVRMQLTDPKGAYPFTGLFFTGQKPTPYRPRIMKKYTTQEYAPHLKATGQGDYIWVFADHCREGTEGIALVPALAEFVEWASVARNIQPLYMYKGMIPQTDWFGPFRPCMDVKSHPQGGLQTAYLDNIRKAKRTEFYGEAEDFCFRAGTQQAVDYYEKEPAVLKSIHFVTDCTSPIIADDPASGNTANADFRAKMAAKGVRMIKHDASFVS